MTLTAKILLVDDEAAIRLTLEDILSRDGHQVITAESGQTALDLMAHHTFDLALLDLNLGDMRGTDVLAVLHQQAPDTVVIMLTAYASLETAVEALRRGAHDYLFKPCQTLELRESIRQGLLKRQQTIQQRNLLHLLGQSLTHNLEDIRAIIENRPAHVPSVPVRSAPTELTPPPQAKISDEQQGRFFQYNGLIVDFLRHVITLNGRLLELSPTEFSILAYLISEAPRVISPQELTHEVQGYQSEQWEASETVRAHIYHIRQKIKKSAGDTRIIRTIRGVGYAIDG